MDESNHVLKWDETRVRKIVCGAVRRNLGLFSGLPRYGRDDLESEMMMLVRERWEGLDPWRGAASTYVNKLVQNNLISLWRKASAEIRTERAAFGLDDMEFTLPPDGFDELRGGMPTAAELKELCLAARRKHAGKPKLQRGRSKFAVDQAIGIAILKLRGRLSSRSCRSVLLHAPDLRNAIRLKTVPSEGMIRKMMKMLVREMPMLIPKAKKQQPCAPRLNSKNSEPCAPGFLRSIA
jgi:hypothetical protein